MSWRQKRLPTGPLLWPEKCYAFTNEENPERLVCFCPYLDLGKTAKKSKKKKPQQGTRFVLVLRRVKDFETPYQLCLFRISMIDCDHPFQLIDSKEWDEHLSYLLPYSFDVSAKLLKGLFEGKTLTKQAEEEAKKVGRKRVAAEKAGLALASLFTAGGAEAEQESEEETQPSTQTRLPKGSVRRRPTYQPTEAELECGLWRSGLTSGGADVGSA
eukprot:g44939.t1